MSVPLRLRMSIPEPYAASQAHQDVRPAVDLDETLPLGTMRRRPAHEVLPMRCLCCQGRVERATAPVRLSRDGYQVCWEAIPAWVCTYCKSSYFEPQEVELVRRSIRAMRRLPKQA